MKEETDIPLQKEEDLVAANIRRDNYSKIRDLQASEYNKAIADRLIASDNTDAKAEI
jgi:hypothetical protein